MRLVFRRETLREGTYNNQGKKKLYIRLVMSMKIEKKKNQKSVLHKAIKLFNPSAYLTGRASVGRSYGSVYQIKVI